MKPTLFRRAAQDIAACRGLLLFLYVTGLAWGCLSASPIFRAARTALDHSSAATALAQRFDLAVFSDMLHSRPDLFTSARAQFSLMLMLGLLLRIALAGGTLDLVSAPSRLDLRRFAGRSVDLFPPLLLFGAIQAAAIMVALVVWDLGVFSELLQGASSEYPVLVLDLALAALLGVVYFVLVQVLKYARISLVDRPDAGVVGALRSGGIFFARNLVRAVAISLYAPGVLLIALSAKWVWSSLFHDLHRLRFFVVLVTSQLVVLLYIYLRNLSLAASFRLVRERESRKRSLAEVLGMTVDAEGESPPAPAGP